MLTIEPNMVNGFWAHGQISFRDIYFECLFLDSHLIMGHSNIGIDLKQVIELSMLTLYDLENSIGNWDVIQVMSCMAFDPLMRVI
jgi:hypothetical protein